MITWLLQSPKVSKKRKSARSKAREKLKKRNRSELLLKHHSTLTKQNKLEAKPVLCKMKIRDYKTNIRWVSKSLKKEPLCFKTKMRRMKRTLNRRDLISSRDNTTWNNMQRKNLNR